MQVPSGSPPKLRTSLRLRQAINANPKAHALLRFTFFLICAVTGSAAELPQKTYRITFPALTLHQAIHMNERGEIHGVTSTHTNNAPGAGYETKFTIYRPSREPGQPLGLQTINGPITPWMGTYTLVAINENNQFVCSEGTLGAAQRFFWNGSQFIRLVHPIILSVPEAGNTAGNSLNPTSVDNDGTIWGTTREIGGSTGRDYGGTLRWSPDGTPAILWRYTTQPEFILTPRNRSGRMLHYLSGLFPAWANDATFWNGTTEPVGAPIPHPPSTALVLNDSNDVAGVDAATRELWLYAAQPKYGLDGATLHRFGPISGTGTDYIYMNNTGVIAVSTDRGLAIWEKGKLVAPRFIDPEGNDVPTSGFRVIDLNDTGAMLGSIFRNGYRPAVITPTDLEITAEVISSPVALGSEFDLQLTIKNNLEIPLKSVGIRIPSMFLTGILGADWIRPPASLLTLEPGASGVLRYGFRTKAEGKMRIQFQVEGLNSANVRAVLTESIASPEISIEQPLRVAFIVATNHLGIGEKFELKVDVRNNTSETLDNVVLAPAILRTTGGGEARLLSTPFAPATLPKGSAVMLPYLYEATKSGRVVFHTSAQGRRQDGTQVASREEASPPVLISPGDLSVKSRSGNDYAGENIYQSTALGVQIKTNFATVNAESGFFVEIQNNTEEAQAFIVQATARGNQAWEREYWIDDDELPSQEIETLGATIVLGDSESQVLEITMKTTNALAGEHRIEITLRPPEDPATVLDAVEVVTQLANEIVVNTTGDESDADPDDDVPDVDLAKPGLQTTLRSAIDFANRFAGKDTIKFDIPATDPGWNGGLPRIQPRTPLPAVTQAVRIDASTHPVSGRVILNGLLAGVTDGLKILAERCDVRGLVINQFRGAGISMSGGTGGGGGGEISGNIIGTDPLGATGLGNGTGISIANSSGVVVGGSASADRNIIAGHSEAGISVVDSSDIYVRANFVGVSPDGGTGIGSGGNGLVAQRVNRLSIGVAEAVSVYNAPTAISLREVTGFGSGSGSGGSSLVNCHIGIDSSGSKALEGTGIGLVLEDCADFYVGAFNDGVRNIFGRITGAAIKLVRGQNLKIGSNHVGTDASGMVGFGAGSGIEVEGTKGCDIGHPGKPSVYNAQEGIKLRALVHDQDASVPRVQSCYIGLKSDGKSAFNTVRNGLVIDQCDGVAIGFVSTGSGGDSSAQLNHFAGISAAGIAVTNSANVRIGANYFGTDVTGNASLAVTIGILADKVRNLFIGAPGMSSVYNAQVGMQLSSVTADGVGGGGGSGIGESKVINTFLGLKARGNEAFGNMVHGLILRDCSAFQVGSTGEGTGGDSSVAEAARNLFAGIQQQAIQILQCVDIRVGANHFGTDASGQAGLAVGVGVFADDARSVAVGSSVATTVFNTVHSGIEFRRVRKAEDVSTARPNTIRGCSFGVRGDRKSAFEDQVQPSKGIVVSDSEDVQIGMGGSGSGNAFGGLSNAIEIKATKRARIEAAEVGLTPPDAAAIGNSGVGLVIDGASSQIEIGGTGSGSGNSIRHCTMEGVSIAPEASAVRVRNTLIYDTLKAIKRSAGQHFPRITNAFWGSTHVEGAVTGAPNDTVRLEFYAHRPNRPSEAEVLVGAIDVALGSGGSANYKTAFPKSAPQGWLVTATSSDSLAGTSEFSTSLLIGAPADSDGDGLPDFWEAMFPSCLNPAVPDPATEDCDNDGFTNRQEFLANTDPTRADSNLQIDRLNVTGTASLTFPGAPGRQYVLERAVNLATGPWIRVMFFQPDASGTVTLTDPNPPLDDSFYRVLAEFP